MEEQDIPSAATLSSMVLRLNDLMSDLRDLAVIYRTKHSELISKHSLVSDHLQDIEERESALKARESNVAHIENVQKMFDDAKDLHNSANLRLNDAVEAERSLKRATQKFNEKMSEMRLEIEKQSKAIETQRKSIEQQVSKRVNDIIKTIKPEAENAAIT